MPLQNSIFTKKVLVSVGTLLLGSWLGIFPLICLGDTKPPTFTVPPTIYQNPNPRVPLAAVVRFSTDEPVHTKINISDGKRTWDIVFDDSYKPADGLPIVGMRPNQQHQFHISIRDAADNETNAPEVLQFTTPPLPPDFKEFPPIKTTISQSNRMEPGITILSVRRRVPGEGHRKFNQRFGMLLALDAENEVIWYYHFNSRISDFERLLNGNLLYITQDYRVFESDLLGNIVSSWYATGRPGGPVEGIPVETMTFHHEIDELPSGNFVVLGTELRTIDNYYTSETNPNAPRKTQNVIGDQIIEFQRDGKIVWRWNAFEHLEPFKIGYRLFSGYWMRRGFPNTVDWTHANGLLYNEQDDSLLVSMRQQDAILKIDRASGEIRWILGEPSAWSAKLQNCLLKPKGDIRWFYHQHAPTPTPANTLLLFDNGIYQTHPFNPAVPPAKSYSRAVEYAIDEENMTVREVWFSEKQGDDDAAVSFAMGDVDWLPKTGNVLVAYGFLLPRDEIDKITWKNVLNFRAWTRVREYTHTNPPEVVWEIVMDNDSMEEPLGWIVFGAERIPSLSPLHNFD